MDHSINKDSFISLAKKYLVKHPPTSVSEATRRQYQKEFHRLTAGATVDEAIKRLCDTRKISTYYKRKYALRYELSQRIDETIRLIEEVGSDKAERMGWIKSLDRWLHLTMALDAIGPACPIAEDQRIPKKSKRRDLSAFPKDWIERLLKRMERSKNYLPTLVTAVSGCRPAELRQGVTLSITDGRLRVDIHGAKVGPDRGQEHRSFEYALPSTYAPINDLANFVDHAGGTLVVSIKNPSSFSSAVVYYGQQAFPRSTKRITPYSMRHSFASDLKLKPCEIIDPPRAR